MEMGITPCCIEAHEPLTGDGKFREMFSMESYQKNTVALAVVCDEVHTAVHW